MKILSRDTFANPTETLHLILEWKLKTVLSCLMIYVLGGTKWVSRLSEDCVASTLEFRREREASESCSHELKHWPQKLTGWEQGAHATGYRPSFRNSSSTVSSMCQYTEICLHWHLRFVSMAHHCLLSQPRASLTDITKVKDDPLQECPYLQQKPQRHCSERLTAVGCGLCPLQKLCLPSSQEKICLVDYSIFCRRKLEAQAST